jgi:Transglycosylase SLT domain
MRTRLSLPLTSLYKHACRSEQQIIVVPPRPARSSGKSLVRKRWSALLRRVKRWRLAHAMRRTLGTSFRPIRSIAIAALLLAAFFAVNVVYHVVHKPTELFFIAGHRLDKEPPETWRQYGSLFRTYSTATITPELLAALAQTESSGNPVARTYWRWQLALNPFSLYKPASSAVGLYQTTDPAYAEVARYCIRNHAVVGDDCGTSPYIRVVPSHAVALAAIYLDRNVASVLARVPDAKPNAQQKQDLATIIHLCGAGPALAFVRRGFQVAEGERCGDHLVSGYVSRVSAMKREFKRLAAEDRSEQ